LQQAADSINPVEFTMNSITPAAPAALSFLVSRPAVNDDAPTHDLFSFAKRIARIPALPLCALTTMVDEFDAQGRYLESLTVGELLAALEHAEVFGMSGVA
jgi:hypothetical protein